MRVRLTQRPAIKNLKDMSKLISHTGKLFVAVGLFSLLVSAQQSSSPPKTDDSKQHSVCGATRETGTAPATPCVSGPAAQSAPQVPISKQQPKRILGIMPNYRAVSAGAIPPPPTPLHALKIATQNSFDYSSFVFVGITSAFAEWSNAHPQLGEGMPGYGRYYWHGFLDKTDGNYLVIFALPTILHQDERYYAKGEGNFFKRGIYAASRILITPDYHGHNSFNASEVFGRGIAQAISTTYYPSHDRTAGAIAVKYGWAMGRDALTNVFREFWPDIATHVLHRHP
jgi:subtilisin family serine protease